VKYELGFYIPEDGILHSHSRENPKSYVFEPITFLRVSLATRFHLILPRCGTLPRVSHVCRPHSPTTLGEEYRELFIMQILRIPVSHSFRSPNILNFFTIYVADAKDLV
jgi:hypothetical protein